MYVEHEWQFFAGCVIGWIGEDPVLGPVLRSLVRALPRDDFALAEVERIKGRVERGEATGLGLWCIENVDLRWTMRLGTDESNLSLVADRSVEPEAGIGCDVAEVEFGRAASQCLNPEAGRGPVVRARQDRLVIGHPEGAEEVAID